MRRSLAVLLMVVLVLTVISVAKPAQATWYCVDWMTALSPTLHKICLIEFMMDNWDPLDWGDGDADNYDGVQLMLEEVPALCFIVEYPTFTAIPRAG